MSTVALPFLPARRRRRRPVVLALTSVAVAAGLLAPLAFLLLEAAGVPAGRLWSLVARPTVLMLLWNTVRLAAAVTVLAAGLGTGAAWLTERTDLPGRRLFAVLFVLPLVIPDFVIAWSWSSLVPAVHGYAGAVLVMSLGLYPLVYLPMAAAFRGADASEEEAARSLGLSRTAVFLRVNLRQARSTLLGSSLLVSLALLAEYGAFENLRYQTFTTAIFTELQIGFSPAAACALSLVLVLLSVAALAGEARFRERGRLHQGAGGPARPLRRHHLGRSLPVAVAAALGVVGLGLGFPLSVVSYWIAAGGSSTLPATASVASAAGYSVLYSGLAAAVATVLALPVALYAIRRPSRLSAGLERSTFVIQALPGLVVALALVYVTEHYLSVLYQSPEVLVAAYSMMFFPLGLVAVRASVARAPERLEEVARSLGAGPVRARLRVTLPLVAPGLLAAFCLVFLSGLTELTATLLLVPTGVETLATQFWGYTENVSYAQAAPYAAAMVAISIVPGYVLSRWFDRRAGAGAPTGAGEERP